MIDEAERTIAALKLDEAIEEHRRTMEGLRYRVKQGELMDKSEPQEAHEKLYDAAREAIGDE